MKRYDHNCYSMDEKADGDWVEHWEAAARIAKLEAEIEQRNCRVARLEHELKYALAVAALHGPVQARIAELEAAIDRMNESQGRFAFGEKRAALIAVRNKSLHK